MMFMGVMVYGSAKQRLRSLFELSDVSRDGLLSPEELEGCFAVATKIIQRNDPSFQGESPLVLTPEQTDTIRDACKKIFAAVDTDGDGNISLQEFLTALETDSALLALVPFGL